jgi:hypothetical protein
VKKEQSMNPIAPGLIPPRPGLEREEPEQAYEEDIAPDDGEMLPPDALPAESEEQLQQVERE